MIQADEASSDLDVKLALAQVVCDYRSPNAARFLGVLLKDRHPKIWKQALDGLVMLGGEAALNVLAAGCEEAAAEQLEWIDEAVLQINEGCFTRIRRTDAPDWRLQGRERYLKGVKLAHREYRRYPADPTWDHDHCAFCWVKFMVEDVPGCLHEGYCTLDEYHWVCPTCFDDFRERFSWEVVESSAT